MPALGLSVGGGCPLSSPLAQRPPPNEFFLAVTRTNCATDPPSAPSRRGAASSRVKAEARPPPHGIETPSPPRPPPHPSLFQYRPPLAAAGGGRRPCPTPPPLRLFPWVGALLSPHRWRVPKSPRQAGAVAVVRLLPWLPPPTHTTLASPTHPLPPRPRGKKDVLVPPQPRPRPAPTPPFPPI